MFVVATTDLGVELLTTRQFGFAFPHNNVFESDCWSCVIFVQGIVVRK